MEFAVPEILCLPKVNLEAEPLSQPVSRAHAVPQGDAESSRIANRLVNQQWLLLLLCRSAVWRPR